MENDIEMAYDYKKSLRTIKARNVVYTEEQMRSYRLKGIYNIVGSVESLTDDYIHEFCNRKCNLEKGEIGILETSMVRYNGASPVMVVSALVFADIWSWHMYAMRFSDVYMQPGHELQSLMN